jgi:hypothetical protein
MTLMTNTNPALKSSAETTPTPLPWIGFDPHHPSRLAAACRHIGQLLSDGSWHAWYDIVTPIATAYELKTNSVNNLLFGMVSTGAIERKGEYDRRARRDHRMVRMAVEVRLIGDPSNTRKPPTPPLTGPNRVLIRTRS